MKAAGVEPGAAGPAGAAGAAGVVIPVSRRRAAARAVACLAGGTAVGLVPIGVLPRLQWTPTAVDNRLDEYALLAAMLPLAGVSAALLWRGARWLAAACWPGRLRIEAGPAALTLALGPFGTAAYDARRLCIRYPFERVDDPQGAGFEGFLPEDVQRVQFLPEITHPEAKGSLRLRILKFAAGTESDIACRLNAVVRHWRHEPLE